METEVLNVQKLVQSVHWPQVLLAVLLLLGTSLLSRAITQLAHWARETMPSRRLTVFRIETLLRFVVYVSAAAAVVAALFSPKPELLVAVFGSAAVAIGFALKDIASSFFAGLILLFDQPFQVGDRVTFQGHYGDIVSIGLRSTRILTLGHDTITIPNSVFLTEVVASGNSGDLSMMVSVELHIAISADAERAIELLREVVVTSRYAGLKNGVSISAREVVGETLVPALVLTARCYVIDVPLERAFATDITLRARRAFAEAGIARYEAAQQE